MAGRWGLGSLKLAGQSQPLVVKIPSISGFFAGEEQPANSQLDLGMSENGLIFPMIASHLYYGIMISKTIGYNGV